MAEQPQRVDPVDRYYKAIQSCEIASNVLFWIAAGLSIVVFFIEKEMYPVLYEIAQIVFALAVIALFVLGLALRLYGSPMAEDQRRISLISDSFDTALAPEKTVGFFNNAETEPLRRLGTAFEGVTIGRENRPSRGHYCGRFHNPETIAPTRAHLWRGRRENPQGRQAIYECAYRLLGNKWKDKMRTRRLG
jgi:hypothetical protein